MRLCNNSNKALLTNSAGNKTSDSKVDKMQKPHRVVVLAAAGPTTKVGAGVEAAPAGKAVTKTSHC
jgi:hypothetical protein